MFQKKNILPESFLSNEKIADNRVESTQEE